LDAEIAPEAAPALPVSHLLAATAILAALSGQSPTVVERLRLLIQVKRELTTPELLKWHRWEH